MRAYDFKQHGLDYNDIMIVVPDSLKNDKDVWKIHEDLQRLYFSVIPCLYINNDMSGTITDLSTNKIYCGNDTDDLKVISIIISQNMTNNRRTDIKCVIEDFFLYRENKDNIRFDLFIEERNYGTFIITDFVS